MSKIDYIVKNLRHWAEYGQHWDRQGNSIAMNKFLKESADFLENYVSKSNNPVSEKRMLRYGPIPNYPEEIRVTGKFIHTDEVNDKIYVWCEFTGNEESYFVSCVSTGVPYCGECLGVIKVGEWLRHVIKTA